MSCSGQRLSLADLQHSQRPHPEVQPHKRHSQHRHTQRGHPRLPLESQSAPRGPGQLSSPVSDVQIHESATSNSQEGGHTEAKNISQTWTFSNYSAQLIICFCWYPCPSIAQLVERRTVVVKPGILRSLVQIRLEGVTFYLSAVEHISL